MKRDIAAFVAAGLMAAVLLSLVMGEGFRALVFGVLTVLAIFIALEST